MKKLFFGFFILTTLVCSVSAMEQEKDRFYAIYVSKTENWIDIDQFLKDPIIVNGQCTPYNLAIKGLHYKESDHTVVLHIDDKKSPYEPLNEEKDKFDTIEDILKKKKVANICLIKDLSLLVGEQVYNSLGEPEFISSNTYKVYYFFGIMVAGSGLVCYLFKRK